MMVGAHNTLRLQPGVPAWRRLALDVFVAMLPLAAVSGMLWSLVDLADTYLAHVAVAYLLLLILLLRHPPSPGLGSGLGAANRVTLVRSTLVLPLAPLLLHTNRPGEDSLWLIVGLASAALALDGVDGWVARRRGATAFGARFDMELDAFLLLVLAGLLWRSGRTGPWVLLIGAMRYLFVAAGWQWPRLQGALPESLRRKTVCVVQGVGLLICLAPVTPAGAAPILAGLALAILVWSFAIDVHFLIQQAPPARG